VWTCSVTPGLSVLRAPFGKRPPKLTESVAVANTRILDHRDRFATSLALGPDTRKIRDGGDEATGSHFEVPAWRFTPAFTPPKHFRVLVLVADLDVRILATDSKLLRAFTLDPTRGYQPIKK